MNDDNQENVSSNEEMEQNEGQSSQSLAQSNGSGAVRNTASKGVKKITEKAAKKAGEAAVKKGAMLALSHVIFWAAIIIIALIVLIGIAMFFVTMPGMVMSKLKNLIKAAGNAWCSFWGEDETEQIENRQVYEIMDYVEQMGYSLKGHGFLTHYLNQGDAVSTTKVMYDGEDITHEEMMEDDQVEYDEDLGVFRGSSSGLIVAGVSDFIRQYIVSDNYVYTISNYNVTAKNPFSALFHHIKGIFADDLDSRRGMITLYNDSGTIGARGSSYSKLDIGSIKIDSEAKTLKIKTGLIFSNTIEYDLDGWTGRYGMPIDFLLAIHSATLMPDLAYDMAQSFDTRVNILLHDSGETQVSAVYRGDRGDVSNQELQKAVNGFEGGNILTRIINSLNNTNVTASEAQTAINLGVVPPGHPDSCGCTVEKTKVLEVNGMIYIVQHGEVEIPPAEEGGTPTTEECDYVEVRDENNNVVKRKLTNEEIGNVKEEEVITSLCAECKEYIKDVLYYMNDNTTFPFTTKFPYIESVTDHWYRDVYFVITPQNASKLQFVKYDYEAEAMLKERWTEYEMWEEGDPDLDGHTELIGNYKLYEINDDGSFGDVFLGTQKDVDAINGKDDYDPNEDSPYLTKLQVAKKAKTLTVNDETMEDLYWTKNGEIYMAYDTETNKNVSQEKLFTPEQINEQAGDDEILRQVMDKLYSQMEIQSVTQVGDGVRTVTNPVIKKMFTKNRYFAYNDNVDRAEQITQLREKYNIPYGALNTRRNSSGESLKVVDISDNELNTLLEKEITYDPGNGATPTTVKVADVSGNVFLNQDSLNAFSMLENTHTLDADYIYRDFKELIVELGFFSKEELTEAVPRLLEFPVPSIGSYGYPLRVLDKNDHEEGTLMHSRKDYEAIRKQEIAIRAALIGTEIGDNDPGGINDPDNTGIINPNDPTGNINYNDIEDLGAIANELGLDLDLDSSEIDVWNDVGVSVLKQPSEISIDEFLDSTEEMCMEMAEVGYDYCVLVTDAGDGNQHCHHAPANGGVHSNSCLLCDNYEASMENSPSKRNFCCATLVAWALEKVGVMDHAIHGAENLYGWIEDNLDPERIEKGSQLEPGDILCYSGHIDMVGKEEDGGFQKYNGGHPCKAGKQYIGTGESCIQHIDGWPSNALYALRIPWGKKKSEADVFEGYEGNEAVVSPVTGILLDYGVYDDDDKVETTKETEEGEVKKETYEYRENVDLNYGVDSTLVEGTMDDENKEVSSQRTEDVEEKEKVIDKVGYAKILVTEPKQIKYLLEQTGELSSDLVQIGDGTAIFKEGLKNEDELEDWSDEKKTIYAYKEFAENYYKYGIAGFTIYIDGFVCELPTEQDVSGGEGGSDSGKKKDDDTYKKKFDGENLTFQTFKDQSISKLNNKEKDKLIKSEYEEEESTQLPSKEVTERVNAENKVKGSAFGAVATDKYVFIKEGTILGRTMTDIEVHEATEEGFNPRKNPLQTSFEYYRKDEDEEDSDEEEVPEVNSEGEVIYEGDRVIGNYLRFLLYDENYEVVENIEDYMKLDQLGDDTNKTSQEYKAWPGDLEILAEGIQHEACYGYLKSMSNKFASDKTEADFEMYCMGYSVVNKLLKQNKQWYGHLYDESRTDRSPLAQVLTSRWYGVRNTIEAYINGSHTADYCDEDLEYAEYCLKYDCTTIKKPYDTPLGGAAAADGYGKTPAGTVIPRCMCQQGGYGDGAPGQSNIILVGFWDHDNTGDFGNGDELWGVDRSMEHLIGNK